MALPPVMWLAGFWYACDDARMCGSDAGGADLSGARTSSARGDSLTEARECRWRCQVLCGYRDLIRLRRRRRSRFERRAHEFSEG